MKSSNKVVGRPSTKKVLGAFKTVGDRLVLNSVPALARITLDPLMSQVLMGAGGALRIMVAPEGTTIAVVSVADNKPLGPVEDLMRLGTVRSFINTELKLRAAIPTSEQFHSFVYCLYQDLLAANPDRTDIVAFDPSFIAKLKSLMNKLETVKRNLEKLSSTTNLNDKDRFVKLYLTMGRRIESAYLRYGLELLHSIPDKTRLADLLFIGGVPRYIHAKLTGTIQLEPGVELFKTLFPASIQKGFTLTYREIRSGEFVSSLPDWLLINSRTLIGTIKDDAILRRLIVQPDLDLDDYSSPLIKPIADLGLFVTPPTTTSSRVIDAAIKGKIKAFPPSSFNNVKEVLSSFSVFLMRVYCGRLNVPDPIVAYATLVTPTTFVLAEIGPGNSYYHQWQRAVDKDSLWLHLIRCSEEQKASWLNLFMRSMSLTSATRPAFAAFYVGTTTDPVVPPALPALPASTWVDQEPTWRLLMKQPPAVILSDAYKAYQKLFGVKDPDKRNKNRNIARSRLTRKSQRIISDLKDSDTAVYDSAEAWLRTFVSEEIQEASAKALMASLDELLRDDAESTESSEEEDFEVED